MTELKSLNMELWDSVEKTDPDQTKHVSQRGGFTSINAHYQMKIATEKFGPVGKGWGWDVELSFPENHTVLARITLWYEKREQVVIQYGQKKMNSSNGPDEDAVKKAVTDGLTKCLSYLGFNADVFLGKFDDIEYVQNLKDEKRENEGKTPPEEPSTLDLPATNDGPGWQPWIAIMETKINACRDVETVNKWMDLNKDAIAKLTVLSGKHGQFILDHADKKRGMLFQAPE
jgi:hypothetical protein